MMLADDVIREITREVLAQFGCEAYPVERPMVLADVASSVRIEGPETAVVEVKLPLPLANQLAETNLGEGSSGSPELIRDLAGELANMIGGNVKGLLPAPSTLSIPEVKVGTIREDASGPSRTVSFACEVGCLSVTVTVMVSPHQERTGER